jgi:hypothetical protein
MRKELTKFKSEYEIERKIQKDKLESLQKQLECEKEFKSEYVNERKQALDREKIQKDKLESVQKKLECEKETSVKGNIFIAFCYKKLAHNLKSYIFIY